MEPLSLSSQVFCCQRASSKPVATLQSILTALLASSTSRACSALNLPRLHAQEIDVCGKIPLLRTPKRWGTKIEVGNCCGSWKVHPCGRNGAANGQAEFKNEEAGLTSRLGRAQKALFEHISEFNFNAGNLMSISNGYYNRISNLSFNEC